MRKYPIIVGALALTSLAGSFLLIPRQQEKALMHLRDRHFDQAQRVYETQISQGNADIETVSQLARLHLQNGEVEKSIEVMERFVIENPTNVSARKELGSYYQYAQRTDDYIRNLEDLTRLQPDRETLERLADIYSFNAQQDKNIETLEKLVAMGPEASPKYYIGLAQIQAAQGKRPEAIATLLSLKTVHPENFGFEETRLQVSLLLDEQKPDEAAQVATAWRDQAKDMAQVASLANLLHYKGSPEYGLKLLEPYQAEIDRHPEILREYCLLLINTGRHDEAFERLHALYKVNALPTELLPQFMMLVSTRGDDALLNEIAGKINLRSLGEYDLIALAELAAIKNNTVLIDRIRQAFPDEQPQKDHAVLMTVLAVDGKLPSAPARLAEVEAQALSNQQLLIVARACTRAGDTECVRRQIARLQNPQNMSDGEIAGLGELYLGIGNFQDGGVFIENVAAMRQSAEIQAVRARFAAALGKDEVVVGWLNANPQLASVERTRDFYFLASNNGHYALASTLAERLYALNASTEHRSYLSYIYTKSGQYDKAVGLLRDAADRSDEDERNYLNALVEMASVNPEYRKEMNDYVGRHLSGSPGDKQKLAIMYSLAKAKNLQSALPTLKEFADTRGRRWAGDYATQMIAKNRPDLAREYWLKAAYQPGVSDQARTVLAYHLLNQGYVKDAQGLFFVLAREAAAQSDQVKRVMYLWGPRPTKEQMAWLASRRNAAPAAEKAQWAELIMGYSSSETLLGLVQDHPELLEDDTVSRRYFALLQQQGQLEANLAPTMETARKTGNVALARNYARTANDFMLRRTARDAYDTTLELNPTDAEALAAAGFNAFGRADYSEAARLLDTYMALEPQQQHDDKTWRAYFYSGEMMRREKQDDAARSYYERAIEEIQRHKLESADALSAEAQSLVWIGQPEEGLATFAKARDMHPNDEVLRLDLVSTLIALKRYDEAREMLSVPPQLDPAASADALAPLTIPEKGLKGYQLYGNGTEAVLFFEPSKKGNATFDKGVEKNHRWVSYVSDSYDQTIIAAKPGYKLELLRNSQNILQLVATPAADASAEEIRRQIALRHELLSARVDVETGDGDNAAERLLGLMPEYSNDSQLLGYTANVLNYNGNWQRATGLLRQAREISPENEDLALLYADIASLHAPEIKLDHEYQKRGRDKLHISTLSGFYTVADNWEVGGNLQNARFETKAKRRADGRFGDFKGNRQRGEAFIAHNYESGDRAKIAAFSNNDTAGGGLYYEWQNSHGKTEFSAEYHRPYWEFVEGILDDATRDRLGVNHTWRATPRLALTGGASLNQYNVEDMSKVARTYGMTAGAFYTLSEMDRASHTPLVVIGYGIDAEYGFSRKSKFDSLGNFYRPFPFRNREVHAVSLQASYLLTDSTKGDVILGYGYDRHGGRGPSIEGRLTQEFSDAWDAQIRAGYGVDNSFSKSDIARFGGYVRYKFQ